MLATDCGAIAPEVLVTQTPTIQREIGSIGLVPADRIGEFQHFPEYPDNPRWLDEFMNQLKPTFKPYDEDRDTRSIRTFEINSLKGALNCYTEPTPGTDCKQEETVRSVIWGKIAIGSTVSLWHAVSIIEQGSTTVGEWHRFTYRKPPDGSLVSGIDINEDGKPKIHPITVREIGILNVAAQFLKRQAQVAA